MNKRVIFFETLNLSPYMSGERNGFHIYNFYVVHVHINMLKASFSGPYVSYVNDQHESLYRIYGCKVMRVQLEDILSKRCYMLLYNRLSIQFP